MEMKLLREHINEKFTDESDPIKDLGIGLYANRTFDTAKDAANWIIPFLPAILGTDKIPDNMVEWYTKPGSEFTENDKKDETHTKLENYIGKYMSIKGREKSKYFSLSPYDSAIMQAIYRKVEDMGYERWHHK